MHSDFIHCLQLQGCHLISGSNDKNVSTVDREIFAVNKFSSVPYDDEN